MSSFKPAAVLKCEKHRNEVFNTHNIYPPHLCSLIRIKIKGSSQILEVPFSNWGVVCLLCFIPFKGKSSIEEEEEDQTNAF